MVRYALLICLTVTIFQTGGVNAKNTNCIIISSDEQSVVFPQYVKFIFSKMQALSGKEVNYSSSLLEELNSYLKVLPQAARNHYGQKVNLDHLNSRTKKPIFVNSIVHKSIKRLLPGCSPRDWVMLFDLCDISNELKLTPLNKAFSFEIASRILQDTITEETTLKKSKDYKNCEPQQRLHQAIENVLIEAFDKYGITTDYLRNQESIEKYIHLLMAGMKQEGTIADYIGLYGQSNWKNGEMKVSNKGITSLEGLELVELPTRITEIDLSENEIFIDVSELSGIRFAFSRFTQLKGLKLSNNHIENLPEDLFKKNLNLTSIFLEGNPMSKDQVHAILNSTLYYKKIYSLPSKKKR